MLRINKDEYFLKIMQVVGERGTCARRKVGCVLTNKRGHIIATGYNGPASGMPHCIDMPCKGASYPSGEGLDKCEAIHAEQNALLQCNDVYEIENCYIPIPPCIHCIKLLLNTSCKHIIFLNDYPGMEVPLELWTQAGRTFKQVTLGE